MSAGHMKPTEAPSLNMVHEDLLLTATHLTKIACTCAQGLMEKQQLLCFCHHAKLY